MKYPTCPKITQYRSLQFKLLILAVILFITSAAPAATIKNLSIEDGLSNRRVLAAAKDKTGYIWFATKTNIDRYDGEKFDSYTLSNNEKNRGITADRNNIIYAYTERSVYIYDERMDDFASVFTLQKRTDYLNEASITSVFFDQSNTMFICTNLGLLYTTGKSFIAIDELKNTAVHCALNVYGDLYIFGTSKGIYEFKRNKNGSFVQIKTPRFAELANMRIQSLYFDQKTGLLWIGTFANGLYQTPISSLMKPELTYRTTLPIKVIKPVSENEIWAGCDGEGVFIFNRYNSEFKRLLSHSENQDDNLGANGIYDIIEADGKVWVTTYTAGIFIVNTRSIVDRQFKHQKFNANSLADDHVNVIYEDSDGDLWFGTNKGLSFYSEKSKRWKHYLDEDNSSTKDNSVILAIKEDVNKDIWVGGYATKLSKINKYTGRITEVSNLPDLSANGKSYIYDIQQDQEGYIWLGGSVDKLKRYTPATNTFKVFNVEGINKILNYNDEFLYLSTYKGIYIFNKKTEIAELLDMRKLTGGEKLISYPFINNIVKDEHDEGILWIATEAFGLIKYNIREKTVQVFDTKSGLTSNFIYGILYDNSGRMWLSTENGLDCFNPKNLNIVSYFEFDGLTNNSFNFLAYAKLHDGKMLFGTPSGVNEISPDNINSKLSTNFNLRFKGFYLFYEKMQAHSENSPLEESIDETKKIKLSYFQHTFSIDFINLDIANQSRTLYSWKLDGFDNDWTQPSAEHKAIYTNLPAGDYTFMVKAIRIDTNHESEIRSIEITKYPPFWASSYAYILYLGFIIWFAYFIIKFWLNKIDNKFTQDKIKFFVSMAHEIRTPITLIKAPLNEIDNENLTKEGRSALELARKNTDKLFGVVTQLLDFQKIEADAMGLCVEETYLNVFLDNTINNFIYMARSKEIDLKRSNEIAADVKVWIDRNKVQIMLENLITNAIKYNSKGGYIHINTSVDDDKLSIVVSDNGIGIPSKAQEKLFESFYRASNAASSVEIGTGIGLMFTKKLIELHKGKITFVSSENVGSTFRIELPVGRSAYQDDEIAKERMELPGEEVLPEEDVQHSMHILLVEDNDELRSYLSRMLRKKYTIAEAANGIEALGLLEKDIPDLILSDIMMPEMDGFELCQKVKTNISTCHIPLILLTALSEREDVLKGLSLGADDYITKPFDISILESKIKTIFNNRALFRKKYIEKSVSVNENNLLNDLNKNFMKKLVELVEANITNEEFNIDELAYEMAMSRSVFFKKVKSLTGQNPKDFIRDIKMNKAADLLRDQKYSVSEIAYLIGFPNAKYFSTAFKKYYGISPTTFIEKEKREESYLENTEEEV